MPQAILECQGSVLTNKYAEGLPGKRYYGGCEHVDVIETLAIERAKALFGAEHANVQPHAGAQANAAVYHALLDPGDTILGAGAAARRPSHARDEDQRLRQALRHRALRGRPRDVADRHGRGRARSPASGAPSSMLAGWSAYPRFLDFERFREIADEVGAVPDGRHGALRRARGGRDPSEPGADRRRGHHHRAQDARRRARRRDPVQGGVRQEDQLGGVPGPAGRAAGARDRRQGGRVQDRRDRAVPRAPAPHRGRREGGGRRSCSAPATA